MDSILQPHQESTILRMQAHSQALVIHDETELGHAGLVECEELGLIGKNQTETERKR